MLHKLLVVDVELVKVILFEKYGQKTNQAVYAEGQKSVEKNGRGGGAIKHTSSRNLG